MTIVLKHKRVLIYSVIALLFVLLAACIPWEVNSIIEAFYLPLKRIGDGLRDVALNKSLAGAWIIYLILGAVPLIFPIVKMIVKRRFYMYSLLWLLLSLFGYVMLYFYINPHFLNSALISGTIVDNKITLIGFESTFFIILLVCVLTEFAQILNTKPEKSYSILKAIIDLFAVLEIFSVCFIGVLNAKSGFAEISSVAEGALFGKFNKPLNYFSVVLTFILNCVPAVFTIILLLKCSLFIDKLKDDAFDTVNELSLKEIIKLSKLTVLVILTTTALSNIALISMSKWLLNVNYHFDIPLLMLGVICIVIIFSQILIRAIKLNEEQKLVI